jgi:hypothetical protein
MYVLCKSFQVRLQMQIVTQLETHLHQEKDRLQAMLGHIGPIAKEPNWRMSDEQASASIKALRHCQEVRLDESAKKILETEQGTSGFTGSASNLEIISKYLDTKYLIA